METGEREERRRGNEALHPLRTIIPVVMETPPRRPDVSPPLHPTSTIGFSPLSSPPAPPSTLLLPPRTPPEGPPFANLPGTRIDPRTSSRSYVSYGECY
ncbi:hypothetical protein KM043_004754 [Ampulex compressa]|nr:hypothetical protein KM043_004754 [Ampulex compressa]